MRKHLCFLMLLLLIPPLLRCRPSHAAPETPDTRLAEPPAEVVQKIEQQKSVLERMSRQETEVSETLDAIEREIRRHNEEYATLTAEIEKKQNAVNSLKTSAAALTRRHDMLRRDVAQRLRASYKFYRRGLAPVVLSAPSYGALLRSEKYLTDILRKDYALFSACRQALDNATRRQQELTAQQEALAAAQNELAAKRAMILQSHQEKTQVLAAIKQEKALQLKVLEELERNARELQTVVDRLPISAAGAAQPKLSFASLKGRLPLPVRGSLISGFGRKEHPDLHTSTFQKGIEIACPYGTEIRTVHDGTVVFADWLTGYGFVMIIDHGDSYYTLLGRASKLLKKPGDAVTAGETVALVGDSYSLQGSCLYFEIRHHGKPQDPLAWLKHDFT